MKQKDKTRLKLSIKQKNLGHYWKMYIRHSMLSLIKLNLCVKLFPSPKLHYRSKVKGAWYRENLKMTTMMITKSKNTLNSIEL